jgi:hypothetical protein
VQVTFDHNGDMDPSVCITGEERGLTPRPEVQQVLETLTVVAAVSSSSFREPRPPLKKVYTKGCLPQYAQYVHMGYCTLLK